jgi:hypothetical protein
MARSKPTPAPPAPPRGRAAIHDPEGEAWHAEARSRWEAAEGDIERYDAPPLPAFTAPLHVTRELLGRFLYDRDANVLHDVSRGTEACRIDRIRNGTFVHFLRELPDAMPKGVLDCIHCMEA